MSKYAKLINGIISNSMGGSVRDKIICVAAHVNSREFTEQLVTAITKKGGVPIINWMFDTARVAGVESPRFINFATERQFMIKARQSEQFLKTVDAHIRIYADEDLYIGHDIDRRRQRLWRKFYMPIWNKNVINAKPWVLLYYPSASMAGRFGMSVKQYEDFWLRVCSLDYNKMDRAMEPLKRLMEKTDRVRIFAKNGTDLTFSIKGQKAVKCGAQCNIPDGEVFAAPVKNSINGTVQFNTSLDYLGIPYRNIRLTFKDGKIVSARSEINNNRLKDLLDSDAGARYAGEFALGVNPRITKCYGDILFDEKINGSFHIAAGNAYDESPNGNASQIHFDMIQIQTKEFGGGEIWFDDKLIRKDGKFIPKELKPLNKLK